IPGVLDGRLDRCDVDLSRVRTELERRELAARDEIRKTRLRLAQEIARRQARARLRSQRRFVEPLPIALEPAAAPPQCRPPFIVYQSDRSPARRQAQIRVVDPQQQSMLGA